MRSSSPGSGHRPCHLVKLIQICLHILLRPVGRRLGGTTSAGAETPAPPPPTMAISLGFHLGLPVSHFNNLYGCYHKPTSGMMGSVREKEPRPECQVGWAVSPDWGGGGLGLQALARQSLMLWLTYKTGEGFLPWHPGPGTVAAGSVLLDAAQVLPRAGIEGLPGLFHVPPPFLPPALPSYLPLFLSSSLPSSLPSSFPPFLPFFHPPFPSQFGACVPHSRSSREANWPCPYRVCSFEWIINNNLGSNRIY